MAKSPNYNTSNDRVKIYITSTENSYSISDNSSSVTVKGYAFRTNTGYTTYGTGKFYMKINGTEYSQSITSSQKITDKPIALFSKTLTIKHNSDGSKTLPLQAKINMDTPLSSNYSSIFNHELTKIPRKSILGTITNFTTGQSVTIPITKYYSGFTDSLTVKIGSTTIKTVSPISNGATVSFTSAELSKIYAAMPSSTKATVSWILTTKNGSSIVGTHTKTNTVTLNANIVPSISSITLTEAVSGIATQFGAFIQKKSKIKGTVNASGGAGSSIASYTININGFSYSTSTFTTDVLKTSGTGSSTNLKNRCVVTVTDKRGRKASTTKDFSVVPYTNPNIEIFDVIRVDANGAESDEGINAKYTIRANVDAVNNKNTKVFKLEYKLKTSTTWTTVKTIDTVYSVNESGTVANIDNNLEYDFRFTVSDYFSTNIKDIFVPTAKVVMDIKSDGTGVAFGKVSTESNALDIGFDETYISNNSFVGGKKRSDIEKNLFFQTSDTAKFPSDCKLYGGNGESATSIGLWDNANRKQIFRYLASNGIFQFGVDTILQKGSQKILSELANVAGTNNGRIHLDNGLLLQWGKVSITPSAANVSTALTIDFPIPYKQLPLMVAIPQTSAPHIVNTSVGQSSSTGLRNFAIYVTRTNTTATSVMWLAIGVG